MSPEELQTPEIPRREDPTQRIAAVDEPSPVRCTVPAAFCSIGLGHSHQVALHLAQQDRLEQGSTLAMHIHWIQLLDQEFQPNVVEEAGRILLHPALRGRIESELATFPKAPPFLCAAISGNEYHYVGLTEHPRRFDFVLPERPDLGLRQGVEVIPAGLVRRTLERSMECAIWILRGLRELTGIPVLLIQSPPPVADAEYLRANPGPFGEAIQEHGIMSASMRMKFWLLQSSIYRQRCEEIGFRYVPVPPEVLDSSGFLQQSGWWTDPVHANRWYGEFVLRQIDAAVRESEAYEVSA